MRGDVATQTTMLSLITADQLVPSDHPIREIKPIVDHAPADLSPTFDLMYSKMGRRSIPPEHLPKSCVLIRLGRTRCAVSGNSASNCSTTCCSSGSWT